MPFCEGELPMTVGFPSQRANAAKSVTTSWRCREISWDLNKILCRLTWQTSSFSPARILAATVGGIIEYNNSSPRLRSSSKRFIDSSNFLPLFCSWVEQKYFVNLLRPSAHICIREPGHECYSWWLGACSVKPLPEPTMMHSQCWLIKFRKHQRGISF